MDFYELLEYLDLESAAEFEYFEAMADLIESEEDIEQEAVFALFEGADETMIPELLDDWFEDVLEGLPEDSGEIFSLMHQIKMTLIGLSQNREDESDLRRLVDEFCRFRRWYTEEADVELTPEDGGAPIHQCLRDAITTSRIQRLGGESYRYSFEDALDYELDSYTMSFAELAAAEDDYNDGTIIYRPEDEENDSKLLQ
ncbi:MAG: hypothetical protein IJ128_02150 [Firmicutes bacterium]|nr:hypothetical protein [Bacillota bacterium]